MQKVINIEELPYKELFTKTGMGHKIYILSNGLKYKEYNQNDPSFTKQPYNRELVQSLKEQVNMTSSVVSFPISIVKDNKRLIGNISHFEEGTPLEEIDEQIKLDLLLPEIYKAELEIERLSQEGWILDDINSKNIIINNKDNHLTFKIIDTDYYIRRTELSYKEIIEQNRAQLISALIAALIPNIAISKIMKDKRIYNNYLLAINGKMHPVDFLYEIINTLSKKEEIDTVLSLRKNIS